MPQSTRKEGAAHAAPAFDENNIDDLAKKYDLPAEYVERVKAGLEPYPPRLGPGHDGSTELHFEGGAWQVTKKGKKPGESTAIDRGHV